MWVLHYKPLPINLLSLIHSAKRLLLQHRSRASLHRHVSIPRAMRGGCKGEWERLWAWARSRCARNHEQATRALYSYAARSRIILLRRTCLSWISSTKCLNIFPVSPSVCAHVSCSSVAFVWLAWALRAAHEWLAHVARGVVNLLVSGTVGTLKPKCILSLMIHVNCIHIVTARTLQYKTIYKDKINIFSTRMFMTSSLDYFRLSKILTTI